MYTYLSSANNLGTELEEIGSFSSIKTIGTDTISWYDGPMVACGMYAPSI
jgi:hypothetical protein